MIINLEPWMNKIAARFGYVSIEEQIIQTHTTVFFAHTLKEVLLMIEDGKSYKEILHYVDEGRKYHERMMQIMRNRLAEHVENPNEW